MAGSFINASITASQGLSVSTEDLGDGIVVLRLQSRWTRVLGFDVTPFVVGDLLVDTGFAHARPLVLGMLEGREVSAICCTHNHEDHTGNCRAVSSRFSCPVYLHRAGALWSDGVGKLKPYRRLFWGAPEPYDAQEMPPIIVGRRARLKVIPTPGHSATHVSFFEPHTGTVFVGDLFIASGASGVMPQENPFALAASLRRVAALEPRRMLNGHGLDLTEPVERLLAKAEAVETAAVEACDLTDRGKSARAITRRIFSKGVFKDTSLEVLTQGEFSRVNFVRAALRHRPRSV